VTLAPEGQREPGFARGHLASPEDGTGLEIAGAEPLRVYADPAGHPFCIFVG